jgi:hypothetical protein
MSAQLRSLVEQFKINAGDSAGATTAVATQLRDLAAHAGS